MILHGFNEALDADLASAANTAMDQTISTLRWGTTKMRAHLALEGPKSAALLATGPVGWVTNLFVGTPDEVARAISSALNSYETMINNLDTRGRQEVLAGTEAPEKWLAGAYEVQKGIAGLAKDYDDSSIIDVMEATVEGSWADFKDRLAQLGKVLPDTGTLTWAIPVAIGGGLVLLYIASRFIAPTINVRTHGYAGRRRRSRR